MQSDSLGMMRMASQNDFFRQNAQVRQGTLRTRPDPYGLGVLAADYDTGPSNLRAGRTVLLTHRMDWSAEQVVAGYSGQQQIERVFRGLKDGEWLGWDPMYHWTDRKIRIHAFYCMLRISLLQYVHQQAKAAGTDLSLEQLLEELQQIKQFVLLYPPQGEKGPPRSA
jgi:transposase